MLPQSGASLETDAHFQSLILIYHSESPEKEPFLQVPLTELPRREMPHSYSPPSFVFHIVVK